MMSGFFSSTNKSREDAQEAPVIPTTAIPKLCYTGRNDALTLAKGHSEEDIAINALRKALEDSVADLQDVDMCDPDVEHFCSDACLNRYLRARDGNVKDAQKMLLETLQWRRDYKPYAIRPEEIAIEAETGKNYLNGFDRDGRPILYMRPGRENTQTHDRSLRLLVCNLEKAIKLMGEQEGYIVIIDYENYSITNAPPMKVSRDALKILTDHYPERLCKVFMVNAPFLFHTSYRIIQPFMHARTKQKVQFIQIDKQAVLRHHKEQGRIAEDKSGATIGPGNTDTWTPPNAKGVHALLKHIDADQLEAEFGGTFHFAYVHETYWQHFTQISS